MNRIKFSHRYQKLINPDGRCCRKLRLLEVIPRLLEDSSKAFLDYDTDDGLYKLPKDGSYMILLFEKENYGARGRNLLTTIRIYNREKYRYYESKIGEIFMPEVEE